MHMARMIKDAGGIPELPPSDVANIAERGRSGRRCRGVRGPVFAAGDAEQRHAYADRRAPGEQPAAGERFVVRMGEHREQRMLASFLPASVRVRLLTRMTARSRRSLGNGGLAYRSCFPEHL